MISMHNKLLHSTYLQQKMFLYIGDVAPAAGGGIAIVDTSLSILIPLSWPIFVRAEKEKKIH